MKQSRRGFRSSRKRRDDTFYMLRNARESGNRQAENYLLQELNVPSPARRFTNGGGVTE